MRRILAIVIILAANATQLQAQSVASDTVVKAAITAAVRARLGGEVSVRIVDLDARGDLTRPFVAQPVPGARTGVRSHFLLLASDAGGVRIGEADATVYAAAPYLRTTRPIRRGSAFEADATTAQEGDLGTIPLQALPDRDALAGAVAAKEIPAGEVVTASMVAIPALVHAGDKLVVRSAAGAVYVQAVLVATQPGRVGDVIRCVNPDTRKALAARVVGPGLGEVVHAF
jgi:flagella basal body P-ring formation protein FlgA